jgi:hypothetical protein
MPVTLQAASEATDARDQLPITSTPTREQKRRDARQKRVVGLLTRLRWTSYHDSLFERPDIIEDDYYRFLNQPRG